jgi:hypothetical protein
VLDLLLLLSIGVVTLLELACGAESLRQRGRVRRAVGEGECRGERRGRRWLLARSEALCSLGLEGGALGIALSCRGVDEQGSWEALVLLARRRRHSKLELPKLSESTRGGGRGRRERVEGEGGGRGREANEDW